MIIKADFNTPREITLQIIDDLVSDLMQHEPIRMTKVVSWLEAAESDYIDLKKYWVCSKCNCSQIGMPCIACDPDAEYKFIKLYETLLEFKAKYYSLEPWAKIQVDKYNRIKNDPKLITEWCKVNEEVGVDNLLFYADCVDPSQNRNFINPYILRTVSIKLLKTDLANLVDFLEIFNQEYWVNKRYPDGHLQELQELMYKDDQFCIWPKGLD